MNAFIPVINSTQSCPQCDARIPCAACDAPTPDGFFVLLDNGGDQGENAVCIPCATELGIPARESCGTYADSTCDPRLCESCFFDPGR